MSSFPSACKTIHVSPLCSFREHTCDSVEVSFTQGGCLTRDQGQMMGTELGLMEMSEVEYTHLQHLFQAHMEAQAASPDRSDARSHIATVMVKDTTGSTAMFPVTTTQAIDLSASTDEHSLVMPGEKTPASYGEVPGFVLARVRSEDSPTEPRTKSITPSQQRARSAARVCIEKRFNTMSADTPRQPDIQSTVLSNFLPIFKQSAEAEGAVIQPQIQKCMKTDRADLLEVSSPFVGGVFNPVTNMCEQAISHIPYMVEPSHHSLIIPKSFSFNFCPERVLTETHYASGSNSTEEQQLVTKESDVATPAAVLKKQGSPHSSQPIKAAKAAPDSAGEPGSSSKRRVQPPITVSQRRERHNSKERERRKRIRSCCDELNMLVPFCVSDSDKVTTLQWTTAYLRYIHKMYGDTFKEEFQKAFTAQKRLLPKSSPSLGQDLIHQEMDGALTIPHAVEQ